MHFCYVDEAGDTATCSSATTEQAPLFALVGVTVPRAQQKRVIWEFLDLKKRFEPSLATKRLSDVVRFELKGSTIRRDLRATSRNRRRRATKQIDETLKILEGTGCQILGRVLVKNDGTQYKDGNVYPRSILDLARSFESLLAAADTPGLMILDSRTKVKNEGNAHIVTTQRFRTGGDPLPHLVEAPVFGHSDTHVALQLADIVASAIVFPIACHEFAQHFTGNTHVQEAYASVKPLFGQRLQQLEYRYIDADGNRAGGFRVTDPASRKPTHSLFR